MPKPKRTQEPQKLNQASLILNMNINQKQRAGLRISLEYFSNAPRSPVQPVAGQVYNVHCAVLIERERLKLYFKPQVTGVGGWAQGTRLKGQASFSERYT
jgi:hypothetical protein